MEIKILFLVQLFCICFTHGLVINKSNITSSLTWEEIRSESVCQTDGCQKAAKELLENMDETVNPCDDFYKFACGGFVAKHEVPDGKQQLNKFAEVSEKTSKQIRDLIDKPLTGTEPSFIKMLKDMYDSCMDTARIDQLGDEPLKKVLASLGGWPVVEGDKWDASKFDWMETLFTMRNLGYSHGILTNLYVFVDMKNSSQHILVLDQTPLGLQDRNAILKGLDDSLTVAYLDLMVESAKKLGANADNSKKELKAALDFEKTLASYSLSGADRRNVTKLYNKYTIKKLQEFAPQIDWTKYMNGQINDAVRPDDNVIVKVPDFVKKFAELINTADKRTVANYMLWRVVLDSLPWLSKEWRDLYKVYDTEYNGESDESPRWQTCISTLNDNLYVALSSYYVRNNFREDSKEKANEVVKYLRKELIDTLQNLDWMGQSTKDEAIEKVKAIKDSVGYPQELFDNALMTKFYATIKVTKDDYLNNILSVQKWSTDNQFAKFRKPNVKNDWKKFAYVTLANAYYDFNDNSIDIPAGILQPPFFNKDRPYFMNFAAIGFVGGHEMSHAFDDLGRQYDKQGNNKNWWDEETNKKYTEKAQCFIDEYSKFETEGLKLNGANTLGENIADNGGLKESYLAYQTWVKEHSPESKLPGLKYTPNQLFWISAANIYCGKYKPAGLKAYIKYNSHSPLPFRVLGTMSNRPEFAEAFQCPVGSTMNPELKCQVW